ncbi:VOC family protein [Prauserella cavernicola]|uniref:VOC family protein n=1 Tax=Prauserella cavernicola TaxID=2800127 RepID=A0A934QU33_9PSEU|nr:VOC family protein [Prauserella cavernicola]MBK1786333.1 VOC family protein [Prauserella cavernicola]
MPRADAATHAFLRCTLNTADRAKSARFYADVLDLRQRGEFTDTEADVTALGVSEPAHRSRVRLRDRRWSRRTPALELVQWHEPRGYGVVPDSPTTIGLRALGFRVDSVATVRSAVARAARDARLLPPGWPAGAGPTAWTTDPDGVTVELVQSRLADTDGPVLSHLRLNCANLERSIEWYQHLGFEVVAKETSVLLPGLSFGLPGHVELASASLQLGEDDPFRLELLQWVDPPGEATVRVHGNTPGLRHVAFAVEDTRMAHRYLAEAGIANGGPPRWHPMPAGKGETGWSLFLTDPDGVYVELAEHPPL